MTFKRFISTCLIFLLLISFACSSEAIVPGEAVEIRPEVNIKTPIDANGILNKVEADAVIVEGTSNLQEGYIVTVRLSDGQNLVGGTAVIIGGKWATESISISGFNNGEITVQADGTNDLGSLSNTAETSLYLDQEPPTIHITGPIAGNDKIDSEEAEAVVVKGTSDAANDQVVLITFGDENTNHLTTETKVNDGEWQAEINISTLNSGSLTLMAEVTDVAGNPATVQKYGVILE